VRPSIRFALGVGGLALATLPVRRDRVGPQEAKLFESVNGLPDRLERPAWVVMQAGALGAAPVSGAIALLAGERRLAVELATAGSATWALSKVVKRLVRRERPALLLPGVRVRGAAATGLGYLSGHAGVSTALAAVLVQRVGVRRAAPAIAVAGTVGLTRLYVGAHLPLDVAGGTALGLIVEGGVAACIAAGGAGRGSKRS
jgi:undecaprenyl-diphosphatase